MLSVWSNAISKFITLVHCWWNYKAELTWEASFQIVYFTFLIFLFLYSFCPHWSQWRHSGLSIFITGCGIFSCGMWTLGWSMWDLVPWPGIEPRPPALGECGVLATGPPEESLRAFKSPQCVGCLRSVGCSGFPPLSEQLIEFRIWNFNINDSQTFSHQSQAIFIASILLEASGHQSLSLRFICISGFSTGTNKTLYQK